MRETEDGFKMAETDLEMRGAGDLIERRNQDCPFFGSLMLRRWRA